MICAQVGETDLALAQLEAVTKIPGGPTYGDLRLDPSWDCLRGEPRFEKIAASLRKFQHARRRFEIKYSSDRFLLVDDYGHHPTEIRATLKTAKSVGRKRIVTLFQPHRYSRTTALRKQFGSAFARK